MCVLHEFGSIKWQEETESSKKKREETDRKSLVVTGLKFKSLLVVHL